MPELEPEASGCRRCGRCCFQPFCRNVREADVALWREHGRLDLIEIYQRELRSSDLARPEMAAYGRPLHSCRFLAFEADERFGCAIFELRPQICRDFEVGCSRICPRYAGATDRR